MKRFLTVMIPGDRVMHPGVSLLRVAKRVAKPLPDPIPLKIQFPSSKPCSSPQRAASPSGLEEAGQPQIPADADEKAAELVAERAPRFAKDEGITDQRSSAPRRPHPSNTAAAQSQTGAPVRKPDPPGHLI